MEQSKEGQNVIRQTAYYVFFFQAEDGIRDLTVTGVQTCALPISPGRGERAARVRGRRGRRARSGRLDRPRPRAAAAEPARRGARAPPLRGRRADEIGRAAWRGRG